MLIILDSTTPNPNGSPGKTRCSPSPFIEEIDRTNIVTLQKPKSKLPKSHSPVADKRNDTPEQFKEKAEGAAETDMIAEHEPNDSNQSNTPQQLKPAVPFEPPTEPVKVALPSAALSAEEQGCPAAQDAQDPPAPAAEPLAMHK